VFLTLQPILVTKVLILFFLVSRSLKMRIRISKVQWCSFFSVRLIIHFIAGSSSQCSDIFVCGGSVGTYQHIRVSMATLQADSVDAGWWAHEKSVQSSRGWEIADTGELPHHCRVKTAFWLTTRPFNSTFSSTAHHSRGQWDSTRWIQIGNRCSVKRENLEPS
jgi:hypothetical protein